MKTNELGGDDLTKIMAIPSFDGYMLEGKLALPSGNGKISKLVLWVNGSGPNTYDNRRSIDLKTGTVEFSFFDFFREKFSDMGIAFFSYNTRGVYITDEPPEFCHVDNDEYVKYLPNNSVEDIYFMIKSIKENERLRDCKVILLGASEGTEVAPLFAKKYPEMVDALFLWGYVNHSLKDVLTWQMSGGSSMVWYRAVFEADDKGRISKAAYQADPLKFVPTILENASFESIDINNDGYIDESDFEISMKGSLDNILSAIERRDDIWLKKNYPVHLTSAWFLEWFNQKSNFELLPSLNLPIYIFHGNIDQSCDVDGVYKILERFKELGKTNLTAKIFDLHDHDLNYMQIIMQKKIPEGIQSLLDSIKICFASPPRRLVSAFSAAFRKLRPNRLMMRSEKWRREYTKQVLTGFINVDDILPIDILNISDNVSDVIEDKYREYNFSVPQLQGYTVNWSVKGHGFITDIRIIDNQGNLAMSQGEEDFTNTIKGVWLSEGQYKASVTFLTNVDAFEDFYKDRIKDFNTEQTKYFNEVFSRNGNDYSAEISIQIC